MFRKLALFPSSGKCSVLSLLAGANLHPRTNRVVINGRDEQWEISESNPKIYEITLSLDYTYITYTIGMGSLNKSRNNYSDKILYRNL
jgi:hypothetical protein